jgi:hypothetical protein
VIAVVVTQEVEKEVDNETESDRRMSSEGKPMAMFILKRQNDRASTMMFEAAIR